MYTMLVTYNKDRRGVIKKRDKGSFSVKFLFFHHFDNSFTLATRDTNHIYTLLEVTMSLFQLLPLFIYMMAPIFSLDLGHNPLTLD